MYNLPAQETATTQMTGELKCSKSSVGAHRKEEIHRLSYLTMICDQCGAALENTALVFMSVLDHD